MAKRGGLGLNEHLRVYLQFDSMSSAYQRSVYIYKYEYIDITKNTDKLHISLMNYMDHKFNPMVQESI